MALNYESLKQARFTTASAQHPDSCILYALGVGAGLCPDSVLGDEARWLFEDRLEVLPAQASVMAYPGFWMRDEAYGLDWRRIVHGEQRIRLSMPLPVSADLVGHTHVAAVHDKGEGRGAVVMVGRSIRDARGRELAHIGQLNFCRGDGGYSAGDAARSDPLPAPIAKAPARPADAVLKLPTSRQQAALYRLTGDRNPLHIDSDAARAAGYPAPLMHGAATVGMACRALDPIGRALGSAFMSGLQTRLTGVFYPGETLTVETWQDSTRAFFRCSVERVGKFQEIAYGTAEWSLLS